MMVIKLSKGVDEILPYTNAVIKRLSSSSLIYMNRVITARIIHAAISHNLQVGGRPKWKDLTPVYNKIKSRELTKVNKDAYKIRNGTSGQQNFELGNYRIPFGQINTRYGNLFISLGNITKITASGVQYGTDNTYAKDVMMGHIEKSMLVDYKTKTGYVTHRLNFRKAIKIPARPFDTMTDTENNAISSSVEQFIGADLKQKTILIPDIGYPIMGEGGRRVRTLQ